MTPNRTSPLRLTFNKPVVLHNFVNHGDEQTKGLKVRIEDGLVHFLPISEVKDADDVHLIGDSPTTFSRKRGGAEVQIAGRMASEIAKAFRNPAGPFFTLSREKDGWLVARPYTSSEPPSRLVAHLRVWNEEYGRIIRNPPQKTARVSREVSAPRKAKPHSNIFDFSDAAERVRRAAALVEEAGSVRRPGRPGREITDARAALAAFEQLATELGVQSVVGDGELARVKAELARTQTALRHAESELTQARQKLAEARDNLTTYGERQQNAIHETQDLLDRVFPNNRKAPETEPQPPKVRQSRAKPILKAAPKSAPKSAQPKTSVATKIAEPQAEGPVLVRRQRVDRKEGRRGGRLSARERRALNA